MQKEEGEEKYSNFKKCCERKIRRTLKAHILGNGLADSAQMEMPQPEEIHTENFVCFCSGSVELQMRGNGGFFTPVKFTLVCCIPGFLGCMTHYRVS